MIKKYCLNRLKLILVLLGAGCLIAMPSLAEVRVAPNFSLPNSTNLSVTLDQFKGKVVYLDFWASWCGPCRQSFPWMNELTATYSPQDLVIIGVNLDAKRSDADKFLASNPASFTILFDQQSLTPLAYGVKGMPTSFVIDRSGKIVFQHMGFNKSNTKTIEDVIHSEVAKK